MLNISFSQPVAWASSPPPEPAPVAPVSAIAPTRGLSRESQSNLGTTDDSRSPAVRDPQRKSAETPGLELQAAPLLPHKKAQDSQRAGGVPGEPDAAEQSEREAAEKAAQRPPLQEVLASVWKASAAVIDVVLGRETAELAAVADTANSQSPGATTQLEPTAVFGQTPVEVDLSSDREQGEPVVYTEQGTSSWAALETGSLVSRKV